MLSRVEGLKEEAASLTLTLTVSVSEQTGNLTELMSVPASDVQALTCL